MDNLFVGEALSPHILEQMDVQTGPVLESVLLTDPTIFFERVTTWPPNMLGPTEFYSQLIPELAQRNAQAVVYSATGVPFASDIEVSRGHAHDTAETQIRWRQLGAAVFFNNGAASIGAAPDECYDALLIDQAAATEYAWTRLYLSLVDARKIQPRVRISHAAGPTSLAITLDFYTLTGALYWTQATVISTTLARTRTWVDLAATANLSAMPVDSVNPLRIPLIVRLSASRVAAGDNTALHEIAFGVGG